MGQSGDLRKCFALGVIKQQHCVLVLVTVLGDRVGGRPPQRQHGLVRRGETAELVCETPRQLLAIGGRKIHNSHMDTGSSRLPGKTCSKSVPHSGGPCTNHMCRRSTRNSSRANASS